MKNNSKEPARRQFTAEYKLRILREADQCTKPGEIVALLRREGLYFSHLGAWRKQRDQAVMAGVAPKRRGRKAKTIATADDLSAENKRLQQENRRLKAKLRHVATILDVSKETRGEELLLPRYTNFENQLFQKSSLHSVFCQ
jgi:transposase-like protein